MFKILDSSKKFVLVIFICILPSILFGQNTSSNIESSDEKISEEDIKDIMEILNVEIYKYNINLSNENNCLINFYIDEYEKKKKIKENNLWPLRFPYQITKNGEELDFGLDQIKMVLKKVDNKFLINFHYGKLAKLSGYPIIVDSIYSNPHACKLFKQPEEYKMGTKAPLLLIGSFWLDDKVKVYRFCWDVEKLSPDFTDKAFDVMPHYYVIGLNIKKPD